MSNENLRFTTETRRTRRRRNRCVLRLAAQARRLRIRTVLCVQPSEVFILSHGLQGRESKDAIYFRSRSLLRVLRASVVNLPFSSSDPEPRRGLRREEVLDFEEPLADALLVGEGEEGLERPAIGLDAVGPEVLAEDLGDFLRARGEPGQWDARGVVFAQAREAPALGGLEGLEEVHGDPAVPVVDLAADRDRVHDREDAR